MISASHNPFEDNGIKFFAPGGRKLTDEVEERLEAELDRLLAAGDRPPVGDRRDGVGTVDGRRPAGATSTARGRLAGGDASTGCAWCSTAPTGPRPTWRPTVLRAGSAPRST